MSAEIMKSPSKFYSKSTVVFNTEFTTTPGGEEKSREEIRKQAGKYKVRRHGTGTGFDDINITNDIS
jgi:hypothetical protein